MNLAFIKTDNKYSDGTTLLKQFLNSDAVIITDLEGSISYWNTVAETVYHWDSKEVIKKKIHDTIVPESKKASLDFIINNNVMIHGFWEGEFKDKTRAGKIRKVYLKINLLNDKMGQPNGMVLIIRDISKIKKIEGYIARLDRLNLIGELAASIGHEVRNPLTTVRGFLQLLASKQSNVHQQEYFNLMIAELDRANSIITEYLSLAKNKTVQLKSQNLNEIIISVLPLLEANAALVDINIETKLNELPDLYLDYREISQVLLNIVSNGIEAMQPGGLLTIKTIVERDVVILSIKDQGKGIPAALLSKIGKPFVTTKEKGSGLGLAVCYGICAKHGATLNIETDTSGTTFFINFSIEKRKKNTSEPFCEH